MVEFGSISLAFGVDIFGIYLVLQDVNRLDATSFERFLLQVLI
jgi:hypothetical protein